MIQMNSQKSFSLYMKKRLDGSKMKGELKRLYWRPSRNTSISATRKKNLRHLQLTSRDSLAVVLAILGACYVKKRCASGSQRRSLAYVHTFPLFSLYLLMSLVFVARTRSVSVYTSMGRRSRTAIPCSWHTFHGCSQRSSRRRRPREGEPPSANG